VCVCVCAQAQSTWWSFVHIALFILVDVCVQEPMHWGLFVHGCVKCVDGQSQAWTSAERWRCRLAGLKHADSAHSPCPAAHAMHVNCGKDKVRIPCASEKLSSGKHPCGLPSALPHLLSMDALRLMRRRDHPPCCPPCLLCILALGPSSLLHASVHMLRQAPAASRWGPAQFESSSGVTGVPAAGGAAGRRSEVDLLSGLVDAATACADPQQRQQRRQHQQQPDHSCSLMTTDPRPAPCKAQPRQRPSPHSLPRWTCCWMWALFRAWGLPCPRCRSPSPHPHLSQAPLPCTALLRAWAWQGLCRGSMATLCIPLAVQAWRLAQLCND